jgi:hypothetical protein
MAQKPDLLELESKLVKAQVDLHHHWPISGVAV